MEKQKVKELGQLIGYGNLMHLASDLWKEDLKAEGYPTTGAFIPALSCDINGLKVSQNPRESIEIKALDIYHKLRAIVEPIHKHGDQMVAIAKWIDSEFEYKPFK